MPTWSSMALSLCRVWNTVGEGMSPPAFMILVLSHVLGAGFLYMHAHLGLSLDSLLFDSWFC